MDSSGSGYGRVMSFSEYVINFSETSFYELTDNEQISASVWAVFLETETGRGDNPHKTQ